MKLMTEDSPHARRLAMCWLVLLLPLTLLPSCSSSQNTIEEVGSIWLDDVPLRGAELVLLRDRDPVGVATADAAGKFSFLGVGEAKKIAHGTYKVVVFKLGDVPVQGPDGSPQPAQVVPPRYGDAATTPLTVEIPLVAGTKLDLKTE